MSGIREDFLELSADERVSCWHRFVDAAEAYRMDVDGLSVKKPLAPEKAFALLQEFDFASPREPGPLIDFVVDTMREHSLHFANPKCFSRFNPATTTLGAIADALVATFNPQLAGWGAAPFPIAVERHLIQSFGEQFGYPGNQVDGTFTTGGSEANHTAVLVALTAQFPGFPAGGVRALAGQPVFFTTTEAHHSFHKAARACGLGSAAVIEVPVDPEQRCDVAALEKMIRQSREQGKVPFMIVGTLGTTSSGAIDPIESLAAIARREQLWFHVDAAWGGAFALVPELKVHLEGIEQSDSISFDAHKGLSVPMSAGLFLTRRREILGETFDVSADYMPEKRHDAGEINPYCRSLQWSRRFIGLKVFLCLASAGWDGYARALRHQVEMGKLLRRKLRESGWEILNGSPFPVVCFSQKRGYSMAQETMQEIVNRVVANGQAWLSVTKVGGVPMGRACITNHRTSENDIQELIELLDKDRPPAR